jgi:tRNA A37 threonylcarbamoyladenosine dehydratase
MSDSIQFQRTELLLGKEKMHILGKQKIIIFGIGGVGSWCAESLIRSGIINLTIVDIDTVSITNINRQLQATHKTLGQIKTEALKARLLEINPRAQINSIQKVYNQDNSDFFELHYYDFIIDAIDSLSSKIHLIRTATRTDAVLISSMGAALKVDPTRIRVANFWDVVGCPFAAIIRKRIRRGDLPAKDFLCVYGDEVLPNLSIDKAQNDSTNSVENSQETDEQILKKAVTNGSTAHITAIFGFTIAGLVLQNIFERNM